MSSYKEQSFLKLAVRYGIIFLVVVTLIKVIMSIVQTGGISGMVDAYFSENTWQQFAKMQLMISAIYGVFMAGYYKFIKK